MLRRRASVPNRVADAAAARREGRVRFAVTWRGDESRAEEDEQFRCMSGYEWTKASARERGEEAGGVEGWGGGEEARKECRGLPEEDGEEGEEGGWGWCGGEVRGKVSPGV